LGKAYFSFFLAEKSSSATLLYAVAFAFAQRKKLLYFPTYKKCKASDNKTRTNDISHLFGSVRPNNGKAAKRNSAIPSL